MDPRVQQEVLEKLNLLASKLGVASQYVWQILVRQAIAIGVTDVIYGLLGAALFFVSLRWFNGERKTGFQTPIVLAYIIGMIIGGTMFGANFADGIQYLINPQFYALTQIKGLF